MVETNESQQSVATSGGSRSFLVGSNVVIATTLVIGIVCLCQYLAYGSSKRVDMTSSRINSLSDATERLCKGLESEVRLTSLYFETDLEDEDQSRYRNTVADLLDLYASTNRSKIITEWINPLSDHEKLKEMVARLRGLPPFADQIQAYQERIDRYNADLDERMATLVRQELDKIASMSGSLGGDGSQVLSPVENLLTRWTGELDAARERIGTLALSGNPQYGQAINDLRKVYREFKKSIEDIGRYASGEIEKDPNLPAPHAEFLREASDRYAETLAALEAESAKLQELKPLKIDNTLRQLTPNGNSILVETADDVRIVDFGSIWSPMDPNAGRQVRFKDRAFKGEERLTSAILRATHKEQTAVVFVRYGGSPMFMSIPIPGQRPAPFATMKKQIEGANFIVEEWDLKIQDIPPTIDPAPTRTIYVVMKPTQPQRGVMGQPSREPPFSESHKQMVLGALGDSGRALFIAGWHPGPFGPIPSTYEYNDYLNSTWGINVDTTSLLIRTVSTGPGKYGVDRQFFMLDEFVTGDHDIVHGAQARLLGLPWCAPLEASDSPPEGVEQFSLITHPQRDGVWGIKNIQAYEQQAQTQKYLSRIEGDLEGPFNLAMAAQKGDTKIVVVSSRDFATDQVAFASAMSIGAQGIVIRSRNPGNVTLMINSLHWLNDNSEFMNIGKPIDSAVLEIEDPSTVTTVQVLTMFVWPALALVCGGVTWWVRRR